MNKKLWITAGIFTVIAIVARIIPHMPNVTPVAALALFAGVYLPKRWSLVLPIAAMLLSDAIVGFYEWQVMLAVYVGFALTVLAGWLVREKLNPATITAGAIGGSVVFFLLTNAATWAFTQMYPHTFAGLMTSYAMGVPFFKFSLVGDLAWTAVFFVAYQLILARFPSLSLGIVATPAKTTA